MSESKQRLIPESKSHTIEVGANIFIPNTDDLVVAIKSLPNYNFVTEEIVVDDTSKSFKFVGGVGGYEYYFHLFVGENRTERTIGVKYTEEVTNGEDLYINNKAIELVSDIVKIIFDFDMSVSFEEKATSVSIKYTLDEPEECVEPYSWIDEVTSMVFDDEPPIVKTIPLSEEDQELMDVAVEQFKERVSTALTEIEDGIIYEEDTLLSGAVYDDSQEGGNYE